MDIAHSHVLLDACCVLNFSASGRFLDILSAIPAQVVVTEVVRGRELQTLQRLKTEDNEAAIQFETAISKGLLRVTDFESDAEAEAFVNYAFAMGDDGESATGAIATHQESAVHRGWAIATDDKKAISFFRQEIPQLKIISTLEVVKYWSEQSGLNTSQLRNVLEAIRVNGRYIPHNDHPLQGWWKSAMK
jgi:hypothetical protein